MSHKRRGMILEKLIDYSNQSYKNKGWALIDKVPTPWTVHYDKRTGRVYKAFPKEKGTVDYLGVSHGRSIAFEAKSTNETTRFPLKNVKEHQVKYLLKHQEQGGISFLIVEFAKLNEVFYLEIDDFNAWWMDSKEGGRKSIPYSWFVMNCDPIQSSEGVALNYLKHCQTIK